MTESRHSRLCAILLSAGLLLCGFCSCSDSATSADHTSYVVRVGNKGLTADELRSAIPAGLSPDDSARYVHVYVKDWIDAHLVSDYAADEIDMSEIDRLTDEYRNRLILLEYRRRLFAAQADSVSDDSVRAYYEAHPGEFILERPIVRGTYLKVPAGAANLRVLRRLYKSDTPDGIDRLEKESLSSAIHYDYFRDRWVDWEQIETRIPYDFGNDPAVWLRSNSTLDVKSGNFVYLLHITEMLPAGSPMPVEIARGAIVTRLLNLRRHEFDEMVSRTLYSRALASGRLEVNIPLE